MKLISLTAQSRLARVIALAALLLVTGLLSAETAHQHAADDTRFECLLCQGSIDSTAATQAPSAETDATPHIPFIARNCAAPRPRSIAPPARGPPALS